MKTPREMLQTDLDQVLWEVADIEAVLQHPLVDDSVPYDDYEKAVEIAKTLALKLAHLRTYVDPRTFRILEKGEAELRKKYPALEEAFLQRQEAEKSYMVLLRMAALGEGQTDDDASAA